MDIAGAGVTAITMHSDPRTWLKLTKFKVHSYCYHTFLSL